jgi:hypothetical protein
MGDGANEPKRVALLDTAGDGALEARMGDGANARTLAEPPEVAGDVDLEVLMGGAAAAPPLRPGTSGDAPSHTPGSPPLAPRIRRVKVPLGLSPGALANRLLREARGELVLRLAPHTAPTEQGWLTELASQALRADVGVVGARVVSAEGTVLHAGLGLDAEGHARRLFAGLPDPALSAFGGSHWPRDLMAVSGVCAMSRRDVLERLGGLDERFESAEACAVDLCLRAAGAGLRVLYTPHARLVVTGVSPTDAWGPEDSARLREACRPLLRAGRDDPFSHPRLGT